MNNTGPSLVSVPNLLGTSNVPRTQSSFWHKGFVLLNFVKQLNGQMCGKGVFYITWVETSVIGDCSLPKEGFLKRACMC